MHRKYRSFDSPSLENLHNASDGHACFPRPDFLQVIAALARPALGRFEISAGLVVDAPVVAPRLLVDPRDWQIRDALPLRAQQGQIPRGHVRLIAELLRDRLNAA